MPDVPPALSDAPQFAAEYWQTVPRNVVKATIKRVTNLDGGFVEIALTNGIAFQRKREEIKQLLTANLSVNIEYIGDGKVVTGMFVPGCGWAFRMTNEDIAEHTRKVSILVHTQKQQTRQKMIDHLTETMRYGLMELGLAATLAAEGGAECLTNSARYLATTAMEALEAITEVPYFVGTRDECKIKLTRRGEGENAAGNDGYGRHVG